MDAVSIVFYVFASIVVVSALGVVLSKKLMYSAFSLLFTFFGVAGIYTLLNADFLAVLQIMIYVGGILVLIVFGIMLTTKLTDIDLISGTTGKFLYISSGILAVAMFVLLYFLYSHTNWGVVPVTSYKETTLDMLGGVLLTKYVLTFLIAAILLLIAFIGAAYIAKKGD